MRYKGRNLGGVCFPRTPSFLGFPPRSPPHPRFARVRRLATLIRFSILKTYPNLSMMLGVACIMPEVTYCIGEKKVSLCVTKQNLMQYDRAGPLRDSDTVVG